MKKLLALFILSWIFIYSLLFNNISAYDLTDQDYKFVDYMTEKLENQIEDQWESRRTFILLTLAQFANKYQHEDRIYSIFNELIHQLNGNKYNKTEWEWANLQTEFNKIYTNTALLINKVWTDIDLSKIYLNFSFNPDYLHLDKYPNRIPKNWNKLTEAIIHCTAYSDEEIPNWRSTMPVYAIRGKRFAKNITYIPLELNTVLENWWQWEISFDFPSVLDKDKEYSFVCYINIKDVSFGYTSPYYIFNIKKGL